MAFLGGLLACEEDKVRFSEPQPVGIDADAKIRKEFRGKYLNKEDSSFLIINEKDIRFQAFNISTRLDSVNISGSGKDLDLQVHIHDSTSRLKVNIEKAEGKDSTRLDALAEEVFFNLEKGGIAKFHKGYYFLNSPFEEGNGYKVRILKRTKEGIIMSKIASDSVLHLLENEEFVHKNQKGDGEEEEWKLNPSRKQLKKMMNMGLFSEVQSFSKVE